MMKIAFVISSINSKSNGLGGHYHSLLETAEQLSHKHDILIINIGNNPAKALENTKFKLYSIICKRFAIVRTHKKVINILKKEKPDILHAFDSSAFFWVRLAGHKLRIPFCITKCGGVNPVYFPYAKYLVLFSKENLDFFCTKRKFKNSNIFLIPNRIRDFEDDNIRIDKIKKVLGSYVESFKFLRITRIGNYYYNSSIQLINLVNKLTDDGIKCCAIFIGTVEDIHLFNELEKHCNKNCFFFTESEFTNNAKALINCADAVLGTGRSFMEAAAKGKILLSPAQNSSTPALITQENFETAFYYNFSERINFENFNESSNYSQIKSIILNKENQNKQVFFANEIFRQYFDATKISEKYDQVYALVQSNKTPKKLIDFFLHTMFLIRNYYC